MAVGRKLIEQAEDAVTPDVKPAPPRGPKTGTGVDLRAFQRLMTTRFPKILAELAK